MLPTFARSARLVLARIGGRPDIHASTQDLRRTIGNGRSSLGPGSTAKGTTMTKRRRTFGERRHIIRSTLLLLAGGRTIIRRSC